MTKQTYSKSLLELSEQDIKAIHLLALPFSVLQAFADNAVQLRSLPRLIIQRQVEYERRRLERKARGGRTADGYPENMPRDLKYALMRMGIKPR